MASKALPSNVTRLPTAVATRVRQPEHSRAITEYRAENPWPGEMRREVKVPAALVRSPELLLVMAMIKALTPSQRSKVGSTVAQLALALPDDEATNAALYVLKGLR